MPSFCRLQYEKQSGVLQATKAECGGLGMRLGGCLYLDSDHIHDLQDCQFPHDNTVELNHLCQQMLSVGKVTIVGRLWWCIVGTASLVGLPTYCQL